MADRPDLHGTYAGIVLDELRPALKAYLDALADQRRDLETLDHILEGTAVTDAPMPGSTVEEAEARFDHSRRLASARFEAFYRALTRARNAAWAASDVERKATSEQCLTDFEPGNCAVVLKKTTASDAYLPDHPTEVAEALAVAVCGWDLTRDDLDELLDRTYELGPQVILSGASEMRCGLSGSSRMRPSRSRCAKGHPREPPGLS